MQTLLLQAAAIHLCALRLSEQGVTMAARDDAAMLVEPAAAAVHYATSCPGRRVGSGFQRRELNSTAKAMGKHR